MAKMTKIHYPFPRKYVDNYARKLFSPIKRGECVTSVWVAAAGRRVTNRFIINNIHLFKKQLPKYKNYLFVYVEPLDLTEESQTGYLRLMGKTFVEACQKRQNLDCNFEKKEIEIFDDERAAYSKLLQVLRKIISHVIESGVEVIFFLGEIDELTFITTIFCNNLRSLWNCFDGKLHYVFLIKDVKLIFAKDYFGEELSSLFFHNVLYVPVLSENQDYLLDYFENKIGYKLTPKKRKIVCEMCSGHPYFLKLTIGTLAKLNSAKSPLSMEELRKILRANYEIRAVSRRMIEVQADKARKTLEEVATKKLFELSGAQSETLVALGLVTKTKEGSYQPFCQLFQDAILKKAIPAVSLGDSQKKLVFDSELGSIVFRGKSIEEKFSRQEYEILTFFIKESDKIHSRDKIAERIWGKESYEKYSDWAIDQLISKLRKKLKRLGVDDKVLVTVRGRGYKFMS